MSHIAMRSSSALFRSKLSSPSNLRLIFRSYAHTPQRQVTFVRQHLTLRYCSNETSGLHATEKPTPFQQRILVWGKMYPSVDKVPDRVSRGQLKKAMDIFRVRSSICMAALVFVFAAMMAMVGRKQRQEGLTVTKIALEKRQQ